MKKVLIIVGILFNSVALAESGNQALLKQFHALGVTHCDEFITKNTRTAGEWKFFLNKHASGIDGPSTEVSMVQISGSGDNSFKTDFSFIQTLKKCFLHKKGQITVNEPCSKAVDEKIWKIQYQLPGNAYKRYKDAKGIVLYSKELSPQSCLLEYEFRTRGNHSVYRPIQ